MLVQALHAQAATPDQVRSAASRAIAVVQDGSTGFYKVTDCFSCHDHGLPMLAYQMARQRGIPFDEAAASHVAARGLLASPNLTSIDHAVQDNTIIDPATGEGWALIAAHAAGAPPNLVTAIYARRIANWQRPDGHWPTFDVRPPQGFSLFTVTAVALRAMQLYMPAQLRKEKLERLNRARRWMLATPPLETEDFTFRLFGLYWADATPAERRRAARELLALQRPDSGWAQLPHMQPDAYSTGEALVALHEAGGVAINDPAWQKGLNYLLSTQAADGTWHVRTRMVSPAPVSPPYFETGFPYGHDQFLSKDATCWAAMALMLALPKAAKPAAAPPLDALAPKGIEPWMDTALFGTAAELKVQLDHGLDPNSKTADGTTLLMMTAHDAVKVKLLIDRGADVRAKAKTDYTALIVAATYFGSSESAKLLLAHGAEAQPGAGVKFDASPIALAAMTGDAENIALLLAKGADANSKISLLGQFPSTPLVLAATFAYPAVVQALLKTGVDANAKDQDGMTALHWAVLAHHADLVEILKAGGANVNATDRFGYTPLFYAASVDFGDAETARALLRAGADPNVKDKEGKTALSQSLNYPHIHAVLETAGGKP
jgi:ankyrin repeat protein